MSKFDKGELEALVKRVTDGYIVGHVTPPAGKKLTPNYIRRLVEADLSVGQGFVDTEAPLDAERGQQITGMAFGSWKPSEDERSISAGPVASMLARWEAYGFAEIDTSPVAFIGYTENAVAVGLIKLKEAFREANKPVKPVEVAAEAVAAEPEPELEQPNPEADPALEPPAQYQEPQYADRMPTAVTHAQVPVEVDDGLAGLAASDRDVAPRAPAATDDGLPGVSSGPFGNYGA